MSNLLERNGSSSKHRGPPPQSTNKTPNTVHIEGTYHKAAAFQRHGLNWIFSEVLVPLFLVLIIPTLTFVIRFICVRFNGSTLAFVKWMRVTELNNSLTQIFLSQFVFSKFAFGVVLGFLAWAILMTKLLPGTTYQGPITLNGNRPSYKDNGLLYHVVTTIAFYCVAFYLESSGLGSVGMIYDRYDEILTALNTVGGLFCLVLYFKGIYWPTSTDNSTSGSVILDYYWGTELHPRMFGIDVKLITNCRFGMSAWFLLVNVFCWKCFVVNGFTDSILITNVLISLYLTKFFHWESGYMKTIDIVLDRAGFYLCYGCICWVPAFYTLPAFYLVNNPIQLGRTLSIFILLSGLFCLYVNYAADRQKQLFRSLNGECVIWGKKAEFIEARYVCTDGKKATSLLLLSGYWGLTRHFHYIPEIMLAFFWTVPALFDNVIPYAYVIFLVILLFHRSIRDDDKCSKKYGNYWVEYKKKVPYRIIPFIF